MKTKPKLDWLNVTTLEQAVEEYQARILESLDYGAYETAELYATNLHKFLLSFISATKAEGESNE